MVEQEIVFSCYALTAKTWTSRKMKGCKMLQTKPEQTTTAPDSSPVSAGEATADVFPTGIGQSWRDLVWRAMKRYPIPLFAVALLAVSLALWLAGRGDIAKWALLAIVLLGGILLLWETFQQFLHKEFSVDVIAIIAIVGSLLLGQYLAGAFVVLMLSGGEALEAYALRRARAPPSRHWLNAPHVPRISGREMNSSVLRLNRSKSARRLSLNQAN